jgi:hypothetical protein
VKEIAIRCIGDVDLLLVKITEAKVFLVTIYRVVIVDLELAAIRA